MVKRKSAQQALDQNYTVADSASAMDIDLSIMMRWVKQLRNECQSKTPQSSPITPERIEMQQLKKNFGQIFNMLNVSIVRRRGIQNHPPCTTGSSVLSLSKRITF